MRRSLQDLPAYMVREDSRYPGLPEELKPFAYYVMDAGHSVMAVPLCIWQEAVSNGDPDMYEVPVPTKYILERGYAMKEGHVVADVPYNSMFGLEVEEKYTEY